MDNLPREPSALDDLGGYDQRGTLPLGPGNAGPHADAPDGPEAPRRSKPLLALPTVTVFPCETRTILPRTSVTIHDKTYLVSEDAPAEGRPLLTFFANDDGVLTFSIGLHTTYSILSAADREAIFADVATIVARLDEATVRYLPRDTAQIEHTQRAFKILSPLDQTMLPLYEDLIAGPQGMTPFTRTLGLLAIINRVRACRGLALGSPESSSELTDNIERLCMFGSFKRDLATQQAPILSPVVVASPTDSPSMKSMIKHSHVSQESVERGVAIGCKLAKRGKDEECHLAWLFNTEVLDDGNILCRSFLDPLLSRIKKQYPNSEKKAVRTLLKGTTLDKHTIEKVFTGVYGDPAPDFYTLHGVSQIFRAVSHLSEVSFHGPWAGLHNVIPTIEQLLRNINPEVVAQHEKRVIQEVALPHAIQINCEYSACMLSKEPMVLVADTLSEVLMQELRMLVVGIRTMVPMVDEVLSKRPKDEAYLERGLGFTGGAPYDSPYASGGKGKGKGSGVGQSICRDFARGGCFRGEACRFQHAGPAQPSVSWTPGPPGAPSPPWPPQAAMPFAPTTGWPQMQTGPPPTIPAGWPPADGKGSKGREGRGVCYQYFQGRCFRGDACNFSHVQPQQLAFPPGSPNPAPASPATPTAAS